MFIASGWKDYEVIDTGDGEKLERWQDVILRRPDPQAIWPRQRPELWTRADAHYHRSAKGGGEWEFFKKLPERWTVSYGDLRFYVHPTGFKHTGLFPEQAVNWDWMAARIREAKRPIKVLNLFGYTGGATVACARAGAQVTHVDAAKGMVQWAGENRRLSGIDETHVRWIVDDAKKFVLREARRGNAYQGILMDPPSYGRGPRRRGVEAGKRALPAGGGLRKGAGRGRAVHAHQQLHHRPATGGFEQHADHGRRPPSRRQGDGGGNRAARDRGRRTALRRDRALAGRVNA